MDVPEPSGFLNSLPIEIRNLVYREYFAIPNPIVECPDGSTRYLFDVGLLRTSKQIYHEARKIFIDECLFVSVESPWPQAEHYVTGGGQVPVVATGSAADKFGPVHLRVVIGSADMDVEASSRFIISVDGLEQFCRIWFYANLTHLEMNRHLSLRLVLVNASQPGTRLPRRTQKCLTEYFGLIKELRRFEITGDLDPDVGAAVKREQDVPLDSPGTCLEKSAALHEAGEVQAKAGKYREAIETYIRAFYAMHIVVEGRSRLVHADRYFEAAMANALYGSHNAGYVRLVLRIKLVASVVLAYLKLEEWAEAQFWGMRSIDLFRRSIGEGADEPGNTAFPAPAEWGKVYYGTAVAAEELQDYEQALEMYSIAVKWLPGDDGVVNGLRRVAEVLE